jgi:hypothetical protein
MYPLIFNDNLTYDKLKLLLKLFYKFSIHFFKITSTEISCTMQTFFPKIIKDEISPRRRNKNKFIFGVQVV